MNSKDLPLDSEQYEKFTTTQWSVVLAAASHSNANSKSQQALEKLCRAYWPPLYAYVVRRVPNIHEAQDLTQAFFAQLLDKHFLSHAIPERGRFRAFLITAFKHFLANEWDRQNAQKRGGGRRQIPLNFSGDNANLGFVPVESQTPDQIYERQWTITLLARVLRRLQRELERKGRSAEFNRLKNFITGQNSETYAIAAQDMGVSESAARMAVSRMRQRFRQILRDEIAQTLESKDDIDDEIRQMFDIFSN